MNATLSPTHSFRATAGWYAGDFHAHTTASDGKYSPDALVHLALAAGLDFISITDHNTVAGFDALAAPLPMPVIRGIEVTLPSGHFNVLGFNDAPAWLQFGGAEDEPEPERRKRLGEQVMVADLMQRCQAEGFLVSINHPLLLPWEWQETAILLSQVHCLEIWNDPTWPDNASANPAAVAMWTQWLDAGYRITAIGGTDFHFTVSKPGPYHPAIHLPRTLVYAEQLSVAAILAGVRQRHVVVSMEPTVTLQAQGAGRQFGIGDDMLGVRGTIELQATVRTTLSEVMIQMIKNGAVVGTQRYQGEVGSLVFEDRVDASPVWYRCDVRDVDGRILAVTNPIFGGDWPPPVAATFGNFLFPE